MDLLAWIAFPMDKYVMKLTEICIYYCSWIFLQYVIVRFEFLQAMTTVSQPNSNGAVGSRRHHQSAGGGHNGGNGRDADDWSLTNYEMVAEIGVGAYGIVYRARDLENDNRYTYIYICIYKLTGFDFCYVIVYADQSMLRFYKECESRVL